MVENFSLVKPLPAGIHPNTRVIKAQDYQAMAKAENLIAEARKEAHAILAQAKELAEQAVADGYAKGMENAEQEVAKQVVAAKIRASQMIQMAESDLVSLVKLTIEKLFGGIDEDQKILTMIQAGLVSMRDNQRVLIRVAPSMEESVKAALPDITRKLPGVEYFEVQADAKLASDMCILEGDGRVIKCSVSEQFAKLDELIQLALEEDP